MPLYEFVCAECGARFEQRRAYDDPTAPRCPNGHRRTRKVFNAPAVVFRDSGWYVNDSRPKQPIEKAG
jgi:putative FmdB family regulatory protein